MLEGLYLGSEQIEEKYLHNFTEEEKIAFRLHVQKEQEFAERIKTELARQIDKGTPMEFNEWDYDPRPSTELDIKYALNQIAADDPRRVVFSLSEVDTKVVDNPDRLALNIAKAFRHNTHCKRVILKGLGLTDNGMLPILRSLRNKEVSLDISGNKLTNKTFEVVSTNLASLENRWQEVNLGKVHLTPKHQKALARHPNLYFTPMSVKTRSVSRGR